MFEELATTIERSGVQLSKLSSHPKNASVIAKKIRTLELEADTLCHRLSTEAERTFITPIDREDIHTLARQLDNIIDQIEEVSSKIVIYNNVSKDRGALAEFGKIIGETVKRISTLINYLRLREKRLGEMKKLIEVIHTLENDGDILIRKAMKTLFSRQKNPVTIIKWKDLYETMERVLDECERAADLVEVIIVKSF